MPLRPDAAVLNEIAPTGALRFGIVFAPEASTFFVTRDAAGAGQGVAVDLARQLGAALGVPVEFTLAPNSGEITEALVEGRIDAAFMPADDERRRRLDVGPAYSVLENTYLVRGASGIGAARDKASRGRAAKTSATSRRARHGRRQRLPQRWRIRGSAPRCSRGI